MKLVQIVVLSILPLFMLSAQAAPIKSKGLDIIPMALSCTIDSSDNYNLSWSEINQAKKYAVELRCDTEIGNLKIKPSNKEASCDAEGNCTSIITQNDFASALNEASEKGYASFPEGRFSLGFSCTAHVRSLPATRHTRPQGESNCEEEAQAPVIILPVTLQAL